MSIDIFVFQSKIVAHKTDVIKKLIQRANVRQTFEVPGSHDRN